MAEEAPETETPKKDTKADARDIESQIQTAMRSRVAHFKEQAEYLIPPLSLLLCLIGFKFESIIRRLHVLSSLGKFLYTVKSSCSQHFPFFRIIFDLSTGVSDLVPAYTYSAVMKHLIPKHFPLAEKFNVTMLSS